MNYDLNVMQKFKHIIDANKLAIENLDEDEGMIMVIYYKKWKESSVQFMKKNADTMELSYVNSILSKVIQDLISNHEKWGFLF